MRPSPLVRLALRERAATASRALLSEVASRHQVTRAGILSPRRHRAIVRARHEWWFRLREELGLSYLELAAVVGLDHSTVMAGVKHHARACGLVDWRTV